MNTIAFSTEFMIYHCKSNPKRLLTFISLKEHSVLSFKIARFVYMHFLIVSE